MTQNLRLSTSVRYTPDRQYVFVELYIMLGDADSQIEGFVVLPKSEWDKELALLGEQEYSFEDDQYGEACWSVEVTS
jgi:hypothetical protein